MKNGAKSSMTNWGYKGMLLIFVGIVALIIGMVIGEPEIIMRKAVNICLECIGIG